MEVLSLVVGVDLGVEVVVEVDVVVVVAVVAVVAAVVVVPAPEEAAAWAWVALVAVPAPEEADPMSAFWEARKARSSVAHEPRVSWGQLLAVVPELGHACPFPAFGPLRLCY